MIGRRHLDRPSERDIARLADGSIDPARRAEVERAVAASPALQAELRDQRRALAAVRDADIERAPASVRATAASARPRRHSPRSLRAFAVAGAIGAVAVMLLLTFGGEPTQGPSVADAAVLATRPPAAGVPQAGPGQASLAHPRVAGLRFPYWEDRFGWRAIGSRHDRIGGRRATTVFYRRQNQVIAYTIVGGAPLPVGSPARTSVREATRLRSLTVNGRRVVTWLRRGHTCVLSGTGTTDGMLLRLAAWRGEGQLSY